MVSMWSWGLLSAPKVAEMSHNLYMDVMLATQGELDVQ
jgi:hypothetical protein